MKNANDISALKDEQLESVAGGGVTEPDDPTEPSDPTGTWTETSEIPIELGNRAAGCPRSGCNQKAMEFDGVYSILVSGSWQSCYCFTCGRCKMHYAKTQDEKPIWYVKR